MSAHLIGAVATNQFPGDIVVDILTRLPVISLLRFKSVCRTWCILFSDPIFIKAHVQSSTTASEIRDSLSLVFHVSKKITNRHSSEIISVSLNPPDHNPVTTNLNPQFLNVQDQFIIVGSINGLLCISLSADATSIFLWNPAIRQQFEIPKPNFTLREVEYVSLGFGYDSSTDDYKVIRILYGKHFPNMTPPRVEVYSRLTNLWKIIKVLNLPWLCYQKTCSVVANGVPYWCAVKLHEGKASAGPTVLAYLMWFDVASECFRIEQLPLYDHPSDSHMRLGVLGGYPAVIAHSMHSNQSDWVQIWTWNKFGGNVDRVTWTKKISIGPVPELERVVGCWKNGKVIAEVTKGELMLYDPDPKCKILQNHAPWDYLEIYDYVESLVSPSRQA